MILRLIVLAAIISWQVVAQANDPKKLISVSIAVGSQPIGGLIYVADVKGFFKKQGLDLKINHYTSGKAALNAVIDGKSDLATTAETPIVFAVLKGHPLNIVATIGTTHAGLAIIANKQRKITQPSDLRQKKIAVTKGTNGEYFLERFLMMQGIHVSESEIQHTLPNQMFSALQNGEVDAVTTWNPHLLKIKNNFEHSKELSGKLIYTWYWNVVGQSGFVKKNPDTIKRVLKALILAENYIKQNPKQAAMLVLNKLDITLNNRLELWEANTYQVRLDQTLLIMLEAQSRWAIKKGLTEAKQAPNFLHYIYLPALQSIDASRVSVIPSEQP